MTIRSGIKDHPGHIKWSLRVTVEYDYGDIFSSGELVHVPQSITK